MWYRDALNIGRAQGTIQCTFAVIYDKEGKQLFALYRANLDELAKKYGGYAKQSTDTKIIVDTGTFSQEGIVAWEMDRKMGDGTTVDTGYILFDLPLVIASEHSDDRLVPVRLDYNAIAYIKRTLASAKKRPDGSYNPRWLKLSQSLNDTATFYVKPAAFDWQPIDISHLKGNADIPVQDRLIKAEKKYKQAKAILAMASATMII